jgi:hypothetical protein
MRASVATNHQQAQLGGYVLRMGLTDSSTAGRGRWLNAASQAGGEIYV